MKTSYARIDGLSVIITTYNGAKWVRRAIESVLNQSSPVPLEVIIIDDCSTDDTRDVVFSIEDPRILFHSTNHNSGVSAARNLGLQLSKHSWIAFNDQDDVWCPERLKKQLAVLESLQDTIGVAGEAARLAADGKSMWTGRFLWFKWTPVLSLNLSSPPYFDPRHDGTTYLQTLIIDRSVALSVGGFNEDLHLAEDLDFFMKIANRGRLGWVAEPIFLYRLGFLSLTSPSIANAAAFIGSQSFYQEAQNARLHGRQEPNASEFIKNFKPTAEQVAEFELNQSVRYINTVWVYDGFWHAAWVGLKVFLSQPQSFIRLLADRISYWRHWKSRQLT